MLQQMLDFWCILSNNIIQSHDLHVHTDVGSINRDVYANPTIQRTYVGLYSLMLDRSWITCNGNSLLNISLQHQPLVERVLQLVVMNIVRGKELFPATLSSPCYAL